MVLAFVFVGVISFTVIRLISVLQRPRGSEEDSSSPMENKVEEDRTVSERELQEHNGVNGKDIYVAIKDPFSETVTVFNVTSGSAFYGPGGPYHMFAAKNATHGLAKSSTDSSEVTGDLSKLTDHEKDTHMQWYAKFSSKYPIIGKLESTTSRTETEKKL